MADNKSTGTTDPGKAPAANVDFRQQKQILEEYNKARDIQEILEKFIAQYMRGTQENAEILADNKTQDNSTKSIMLDAQATQHIVEDLSGCDFDTETGAIIVRGEARPELDPNSAQFNPEQYILYAGAINERLNATLEQLRTDIKQYAASLLNTEGMRAIIDTLNDVVTPLVTTVANTVSSIVDSDAYKGITNSMRYIVEHNEELQQRVQEWERLEPYIIEEIKKPEYGGKTLDEIFNISEVDENGEYTENSLISKAIEAARAAMIAQKLPIITVDKINALDYPLDKINNNIWKLLKDADKNGQITVTFAMEKKGGRKEANVTYSINFDALEQQTGVTITKKLTTFDKRVYIAVGALYNNGFEVLSVAQIYNAMGNTGRPSAADIKKINDSLTKMQAAHIFLSNEHEVEIAKYRYDKFVYDASLLPMERISAIINGQTVDSAIHLFREPPLISFARDRKQITTISRRLLESPLSKTDANLLIDDYLIERISSMKNARGKLGNKILYATIYEECRISSKMQRSRAPEKIRKYLSHYKECKFIKDYKEEENGVTIIY